VGPRVQRVLKAYGAQSVKWSLRYRLPRFDSREGIVPSPSCQDRLGCDPSLPAEDGMRRAINCELQHASRKTERAL
jgi:hypothetical protein